MYLQSQNAERHREAAQQLYAQGRAYYCDCLRFRTPTEGEMVVVDLVRGEPSFPNSAIEDFVIARGDGSPVFLIANVVDDLDEGITLVICGDEHLSNTPKQQLLWVPSARSPRYGRTCR